MSTVKAPEIWTAQTLCDVGILLSIVSMLLHLGRPYFERILGRLTLRVAADIWWLLYVVLQDGTLFLAVLLGFWGLNLDLMADIKIGLPFVPLGTVALAGALLMGLPGITDADADRIIAGQRLRSVTSVPHTALPCPPTIGVYGIRNTRYPKFARAHCCSSRLEPTFTFDDW